MILLSFIFRIEVCGGSLNFKGSPFGWLKFYFETFLTRCSQKRYKEFDYSALICSGVIFVELKITSFKFG